MKIQHGARSGMLLVFLLVAQDARQVGMKHAM